MVISFQNSGNVRPSVHNGLMCSNLDELTQLKGSLRHLVKNYTVSNPGAQAAWTSAAHVERAPKKKDPPTP